MADNLATNLNGKIALVTGGSRGIGAAIARRLAADGAKVALTYAGNEAAANETVAAIKADGGEAVAIRANAADPAEAAGAVEKTVDAFGALDILVHNAGYAQPGHITEQSFDEFRQQFAVNVDGVYAGTHAAANVIRDGGRIIIISSVNAHSMPMAGLASYGATKAAVSAFAKGWARDLGERNILVNAIQPGPVDTDLNPADGDFAGLLTPMTALKRYGRPEEIANLAAFLASDEASYITGATIDIDGGMTV